MASYTEIPDEAVDGLERTGKIHLGVRVKHPKTGKEYPSNVDYFVCPEEVQKVFGEKPRTLLVVLPVDDPSHIVPHCFKKRGAHGISCRGDGRTYTRWIWDEREKRMENSEGPCPKPADCDFAYDPSGRLVCRREANVQVMIPEANDLYTYQIDTGNRQSILNIRRALFQVRAIRGTAAGHPILMRRVETVFQSGEHKGKKDWPIVFRFLTEDEEERFFKKYPRTARFCARLRALIEQRRIIQIPQVPQNYIAENLMPADIVRTAVRSGGTTGDPALDAELMDGEGEDAVVCCKCQKELPPSAMEDVDRETGEVVYVCEDCADRAVGAKGPVATTSGSSEPLLRCERCNKVGLNWWRGVNEKNQSIRVCHHCAIDPNEVCPDGEQAQPKNREPVTTTPQPAPAPARRPRSDKGKSRKAAGPPGGMAAMATTQGPAVAPAAPPRQETLPGMAAPAPAPGGEVEASEDF